MKTELQNWIDEQGVTAGYRTLGDCCGVCWQTAQHWVKRNRPPAERCLAIEALTGISRYRLRPDVYGSPDES